MKKRFIPIIAVLLLLSCFVPSAWAATTAHVADEAELFTSSQLQALEEKAAAISQRYKFGIYLITVDNFRNYTNSNTISDFVIALYDGQNLGMGSDRAGASLAISMAERDYNLDFNSSRADEAFTEAGRDRMEERILSYLRRDDYYGGFNEYLDICEEYLAAAEAGHPVGQGEWSADDGAPVIVAVILGLVAAAVIGLVLWLPMKTAKIKHDADQYAVPGSLNLNRRSDMFLRRSVSRRPRETQSGGGGGHSRSYSSGSHSGRSGKF